MSRLAIYKEIVSSPVIYEVYPINRPKVRLKAEVLWFLLFNVVVVFVCVLGFYYFSVTFEFKMVGLVLLEILFMSGMVISLFRDNAKRMKLVFTEKGLALYPNTFICGLPVATLIAEKWKDVEGYSIHQVKGLMAIGAEKSKGFYLYVKTNGVVRRCVNNYGMSVFAVTGHFLDENDVLAIQNIFKRNNIVKIDN